MQGKPSRLASNGGARCVTEISGDDGRVVAVVHDAALRDDPTFLDVARSSVLKALEIERLGTELRSSLRELRESRARIMSSADRERQRIERDLHDGAQQSLVALRIRLELAGELLRESPARAEQLLSELGTEVDEALEQVRSLARGVYPSLLADRGLREALRAAALRSPVRTTVDTDGIGRYRPEVEAAVYFCCLEAMQNAMKHAGGVETISVSLAVNGDLRFEVRDDGAGFAEEEVVSGAGLTNMRDRLAAVGGLLTIRTAPGEGTSVLGVVPLTTNGSSPLNGSSPMNGSSPPGEPHRAPQTAETTFPQRRRDGFLQLAPGMGTNCVPRLGVLTAATVVPARLLCTRAGATVSAPCPSAPTPCPATGRRGFPRAVGSRDARPIRHLPTRASAGARA